MFDANYSYISNFYDDGYAICTGYTSIMEVFLSKLNIPNYKISSGFVFFFGVL